MIMYNEFAIFGPKRMPDFSGENDIRVVMKWLADKRTQAGWLRNTGFQHRNHS